MHLKFTTTLEQPGIIADILGRSYAELVSSDPECWEQEKANWEEFDGEIFQFPDTVGRCAFLTWWDNQLVGFGSYDPRQAPQCGIVGHNCILPQFRGRGFGNHQVKEILRRFDAMKIVLAKVSTNDHPFFIPAQKMYVACGFVEVRRMPWDRSPGMKTIHYEKKL